MPAVFRLLTAVACGFLYGLCFPPMRARWLAWVVLVPLLLAMRGLGAGRAAALAGLFAAAGTVATVDWLPRTVVIYYGQSWAVGVVLFVVVMLLMVLPWVAAFGAAARTFMARAPVLSPLLVGAAWVSAEFARSSLLTGNPWVLLGYSQVGARHVVQIADLAGVYGISFVVVVVNVALANGCLALAARDRLRASGNLGLAAAVVAAVVAYGEWRLSAASQTVADPVRVAVVQGNLDLGARWRRELYGRNLDVYLRLTIDTLEERPADLVVWPETAMTFFLADEPLYQSAIARVLEPWNAELLAGGPYVVEGEQASFFNSAFVLSPQGRILGRYDKEKLLPFAEYFPLPELDLLRRSFGRVREFTAGPPTEALPTLAGRAGVLICNEAIFPEIARRRVLGGATVLVNLSNDTWVNDGKFSAIMFDMSALRAVEQRRYLIRASTSGPSAVVDPYGRVEARTGLFRRETTSATVRPGTTFTPYARLGDLFAWLCVATTLAALLAAIRRRV